MKFRYQRWMIKTSLVYLFLGISIGFLTFLAQRIPELAWILTWRTVHVHLILVGSVIQIIMGVALWMFPRRKEPPGWTTEREGMTLYVGFNAGTLVRSVFEPFWQSGLLPYLLTLSGMILQILSLLYFLLLIFQRIRAPSA
ncbi:MAG: hypothetical protein Q8S00_13200 [Deltaproteobacteria bacterium]|nr:hypothetical protein [Deltaproteobacteria bacterium]MDZ4340875.1 hypothetical protein [Candidatus Binatia bacterium]